jgi:two-component system, cell cycle response regulator DivK
MHKILIIEDVDDNIELLKQLLEDEYDLVTAGDGLTGIERAHEARPDLILMDMSLPGIDGMEATRRIKANGALKHIIVIGLSAHAMSGDAERALAAGCDDYLTKPIDEDVLVQKLERWLGS